jgi:hypothetical protein
MQIQSGRTVPLSLYYLKKIKQYRTNNHIKIAKSVKIDSSTYINNDKFHKKGNVFDVLKYHVVWPC